MTKFELYNIFTLHLYYYHNIMCIFNQLHIREIVGQKHEVQQSETQYEVDHIYCTFR